jgi:hypothetical protein
MSKRESMRARRIEALEVDLTNARATARMHNEQFELLCIQLGIEPDSDWKDVRDAIRELKWDRHRLRELEAGVRRVMAGNAQGSGLARL